MPSVSALIPQITPTGQLIRVNGFLASIQSAMALLAPAAAGAIFAASAASTEDSPLAIVPILFIDVVTAATAIALLATIPVSPVVRTGADAATGYFADLVDGVRYVADHEVVRWLLLLFGIIFVLTVAPVNLIPLLLVRSFPSGEQGNVVNLALFEMAFSLGMVVGGVLVATLASKWDRIRLIAASSLTFGLLSIALGLAPGLLVVFAVMLLVGTRRPVLLDAVDDAPPGDRRAGAAGPRVRLRRDRDGRRDARRDALVRAAGRRGRASRLFSSPPGWRRSRSWGSPCSSRRAGAPWPRRMPCRARERWPSPSSALVSQSP